MYAAQRSRDVVIQQKLQEFGVLAVKPGNQDMFAKACSELDVDVITLDPSERTKITFRRELVGQAIDRGVVFEVHYAHAFRGKCLARRCLSRVSYNVTLALQARL